MKNSPEQELPARAPMPSALRVSLAAAKGDPVFSPGKRGARKMIVTKLRADSETPANESLWAPPSHSSEKCPVLLDGDTEVALFSHAAPQDRHYHRRGMEVYMPLEGRVVIEVQDETHALSAGDMLVVRPGAIHEVLPSSAPFLCRVVTVHCGGEADKVLVDSNSNLPNAGSEDNITLPCPPPRTKNSSKFGDLHPCSTAES